MEQAIKELEKHLKRLQEEQEKDIYIEAVCQYMGITMEEVKRRAITAQEQGNQNGNRIADNIITELKKNPDAFIGLSEIEKLKLFTKCEDLVKEENPTRTKMIHYLSSFLNYLGLEEHQTFLELDKLSEILQYINLSINSQITILTNIIRVNSQLDIRDESSRVYLPNTSVLLEHQYQHMDGNELFEILVNNRFDEFLEDENYPNKAAQKEVEEMFERTKIDYTDIQDACNALDKIFIKDSKDVTEEEYQTIVEKMEQIHFGHIAHRIVKKIKKDQENALNQAIKTGKQTLEKHLQTSPKKEPKFKQRKINQVHYEINKLYDLENFKSRTTLSLDEIIYILSLMYSIEMDTEIITKFLSSVSHEYKKNNPFAIYYQSKEKYEASNDEGVSEHLEMIKYILSDFDIFSCSDEKYTEAKSMISEEITAINQILEGNHTYEIDKAKQLLKEKGGK